MSVAFSVNVYGTVNQQPPYAATDDGNLSAIQATYKAANVQIASFPSAEVNCWPIQPGVKMAGGVFCYGVVEVPASGLELHSTKYVVKETVAVLATLRG